MSLLFWVPIAEESDYHSWWPTIK